MCKFCRIIKARFNIETETDSDKEFEYLICSYFSAEKLVTKKECDSCPFKQD